MEFWGHSENAGGRPESLKRHLLCTANRAKEFAHEMGWANGASCTGLLHDLGKYADQFQKRVRGAAVQGKDHWSAGAAVMISCYGERGFAPALAIQGHHVGLPDITPTWHEHRRLLNILVRDKPDSLTDANLRILTEQWQADGFTLSQKLAQRDTPHIGAGTVGMLDVRMFFSALVDADFIETEAHFNGDEECDRRYRPNGPPLDAQAAFKRVTDRVAELSANIDSHASVRQMRDSLWNACVRAAEKPSGLFTLTAPTGSGKTLAMLGFALRHALNRGMRRVVLVMPFLNIIEQTAQLYHDLFSTDGGFAEHFVLEDHSLANDAQVTDDAGADGDAVDEPTRTRRLLAENWDAPIILTSHVKCLESLMAHRPSRCRKLHRLAKSVIMFDEVQTLPPKLAVPTLATLGRLADPDGPFKSSVLFATATQPAFEHLDGRVRELNAVGWQSREIVCERDQEASFAVAGSRVHVNWRHESPVTLQRLANELAKHESRQVLCIVNLKRHAAGIAQRLVDDGWKDVQHLSTNLCPQHRRRVLDAVEASLRNDEPLRLIATQCVEAGVDLDFPAVYRAIAPLDAIAQAAGRCNRHGTRPQSGKVIVVDVDDGDGKAKFPPGYNEAVTATIAFLAALRSEHGGLDELEILNNPERLRRYYRTLYDLTGRTRGNRPDERELIEAIIAGQFARVDQLYRLIDTNTINVLVPDDADVFHDLVKELDGNEPRTPESVREWISRARPLTVGIFRPCDDSAAWSVLGRLWFSGKSRAEDAAPDWWYLLPEGKYHSLLGLRLPEEMSWVL